MISEKIYIEKREELKNKFKSELAKGPVALGKKSSNLFRYRDQSEKTRHVDVREFNNVISIDIENQTVDVEGMATYETVVAETLKHGFMPAVVPELKLITVGGAITGVGIEATSFRYGLVHETMSEIEVLLSSGEVVIANPHNEYKDLFFAFPNSYGTLGYALRCKIKIIPVKKYVKVERKHYSEPQNYFKDLQKYCNGGRHDFIDGVAFNKNDMYINLASFTDEASKVSDYTYMNIYYRSIKKKPTDYLTAKGYIWRWDTDWFWCSQNIYMENKLIRLILGRKFLNSGFYNKLRGLNAKYKPYEKLSWLLKSKEKEAVIQDVEIPIENCPEFFDFFQENIKIKPLWNCPVRSYKDVDYTLYPVRNDILYVNFGFWDYVPFRNEEGYHNKLVEKKVEELGGKKSLYSDSYYTEEKFWQLYNGEAYRQLKAKYDKAGKFLNLYEKCVKKK